ncbi:sulfurtransferase TusA family protein [Thermodesulfobacteriota bacterium]
MSEEEYTIDKQIDITKDVCPFTFVKAKIALDSLESGAILEITLNKGEAMQNVPRSVKDEGHQILKLKEVEEGIFTLIVKKKQEG